MSFVQQAKVSELWTTRRHLFMQKPRRSSPWRIPPRRRQSGLPSILPICASVRPESARTDFAVTRMRLNVNPAGFVRDAQFRYDEDEIAVGGVERRHFRSQRIHDFCCSALPFPVHANRRGPVRTRQEVSGMNKSLTGKALASKGTPSAWAREKGSGGRERLIHGRPLMARKFHGSTA